MRLTCFESLLAMATLVSAIVVVLGGSRSLTYERIVARVGTATPPNIEARERSGTSLKEVGEGV
jgi:hypothetical protein